MPKKLSPPFIAAKIDKKKIKPPGIVQLAVDDKYKFSMLTTVDASVFIQLKDSNDEKAERNLRQNLFQHIKRAKDKEMIIRKMREDPDDPNSPIGFRVWVTKLKKV